MSQCKICEKVFSIYNKPNQKLCNDCNQVQKLMAEYHEEENKILEARTKKDVYYLASAAVDEVITLWLLVLSFLVFLLIVLICDYI